MVSFRLLVSKDNNNNKDSHNKDDHTSYLSKDSRVNNLKKCVICRFIAYGNRLIYMTDSLTDNGLGTHAVCVV